MAAIVGCAVIVTLGAVSRIVKYESFVIYDS